MSPQSSILVGCSNKTVSVRVEGKGSFLNSSALKEFGKEMVHRGYREFVVDLRNCSVMDSTFMGTLAGIALSLRETGQLHLVNLNDRNRDLICNLGLDRLFSIEFGSQSPDMAPKQHALQGDPAPDKTERTQMMLEAHEALVEADSANLTKFKDVLEYLKHDLQAGG